MRRGVVASEIMVRITKPGALLLFHTDGRWHLHDATRGGRVLSGGEARYAPSYKFQKNNKNTGQNWSTYSFTITKEKPKDMNVKVKGWTALKCLLLLLAFVVQHESAKSQIKKNEAWIYGAVLNRLTGETLVGVNATLMKTDSTVIATSVTSENGLTGSTKSPWSFIVPKEQVISSNFRKRDSKRSTVTSRMYPKRRALMCFLTRHI